MLYKEYEFLYMYVYNFLIYVHCNTKNFMFIHTIIRFITV